MKKIYLNPTLDVVEIDVKAHILAASAAVDGGNSDGGTNTETDDPTDPNWGWDF